jgi:hypothetical protein
MTVKDFVEDWIQMRIALQRQIRAMESREARPEGVVAETTDARLKLCLHELNALLKEHATAELSQPSRNS